MHLRVATAIVMSAGVLLTVDAASVSATPASSAFVERTVFASVLSSPVAAPPSWIQSLPGGDLVIATASYPTSDGIRQMTRIHGDGSGSTVATPATSGLPTYNHDLFVTQTNGTTRVLVSSPNIVMINQRPALAWSTDGSTVYFVVTDATDHTWKIESVPYSATNAVPTVVYSTSSQLGSIVATADSLYVKDELTDEIDRISFAGSFVYPVGPSITGDMFSVRGANVFRWDPSNNALTVKTGNDTSAPTVIAHPAGVLALSVSSTGTPVALMTGASTLKQFSLLDGSALPFGPPASPSDVAISSSGQIYLTSQVDGNVVRLDPATTQTTPIAAGIGTTVSGTVDDPTVPSPFHTSHPAPMPLAIAANGDLYVSDLSTHHINRISGGTVTQLPGTFTAATGLRVDGSSLIVADAVAQTTTVEKLDGTSPTSFGTFIGTTKLDPWLTTPIPGSTDRVTIDNFRFCVVRSSATGLHGTALISVDTCTGPAESGLFGATSAIVGHDGYVYVADAGKNRVVRMHTDGSGFEVVATSINYPEGLALDPQGNLWVAARGGLFEYLRPLSLAVSQNPAQRATPLTITATVSGGSGPENSGTVAFFAGATSIAGCSAVAVHASAASCRATLTSVGSVALTARFSGTSSTPASTSAPLTERVVLPATATLVLLSRSSVVHGGLVGLHAKVTSTAAFGLVSVGTVTFSNAGVPIRGCTGLAVRSGIASCTAAFSRRGGNAITAAYVNNVRWANSTSRAVTLTVT